MKTYGIDIETHDPLLKAHGKDKARGESWIFNEGEVLFTGIYNAQTKKKTALNGNGGEAVKKLLQDPNAELVGARIVYDIGWLCWSFGLTAKDVKCSLVDISIIESLIDEFQNYALDDLAVKYLHERKGSQALAAIAVNHGLTGDFRGHLQALWHGDKAKQIPSHKEEIKAYVISDADQPVRIYEEQKKILTANNLWEPAIRKSKLILVTLMMKQRGIKVDTKKKALNYAKAEAARKQLEKDFDTNYRHININSTKQLAELFDENNVPYRNKIRIKGYTGQRPFAGPQIWEQRKALKAYFPGVRVMKGQIVLFVAKQYAARTAAEIRSYGYDVTSNPSIDAKAILKLRAKYKIAADVAELKQVTSVITKFLGPEFDRFIAPDGRIHCTFNISGARKTGRFSSSAPNLQQVPSKTMLFRGTNHEVNLAEMCRELLIADSGKILGKMDYSGQENVLMAHFAVGPGSKEIRVRYRTDPDFDFHTYIGDLSGLIAEYGAKIGRKYAKNCGFGLGYGMQLATMMENFGWDQETAQTIMDGYNDAAPFVRATMEAVAKLIVNRGYIITLGLKRLHLQKFNGKVDVRSAYKGFNKLIQGSGVDMMEEALVKIYYSGLDDVYQLLLTVHDEIVFSMENTKEALKGLSNIKQVMEHAIQDGDSDRLSIPIKVDPEVGKDWWNLVDVAKNKAKLLRSAA